MTKVKANISPSKAKNIVRYTWVYKEKCHQSKKYNIIHKRKGNSCAELCEKRVELCYLSMKLYPTLQTEGHILESKNTKFLQLTVIILKPKLN